MGKHGNIIDAANETNRRLRKIEESICCSSPNQEIQTYSATISADTDIVAAVSGKRIRVIGYTVLTASTAGVTLTLKSGGTSGTVLLTLPLQALASTYFGANMVVQAPSFLFQTNIGEKLTADLSAAEAVTVNIFYYVY